MDDQEDQSEHGSEEEVILNVSQQESDGGDDAAQAVQSTESTENDTLPLEEEDEEEVNLKTTQLVRNKRVGLTLKTVKEIEDALASENVSSIEKRKLQKWKFCLESSLKQIDEMDQAILKGMLLLGHESELEAELEATSNFQTDVHVALEDLNEALKTLSTGDKGERATTSRIKTVNVKLPKLNLRRFDGNLLNWVAFWDSFEGTIHERSDLAEREKFEYLKGQLDGDALNAINNYKLNAKNYEAAVKLLKERYGDKEKISRLHYEALMKLQAVHSDNDLQRIRKFYNEVETNHRALIALGKKQENYSDILVPQIETKLPTNLRVSVLQKKKEGWLLDEMLSVLEKEIKIRESSTQPDQTDSKSTRRGGQVTTGSALVGAATPQKSKCAYCLGDHNPEECSRVTDIGQRKQILRKYMRCFACLRKNHRIKDCRSKKTCDQPGCGEVHHRSICEKGKEEVVIPSLHTQTKGSIALETLQATVRGADGCKKVRCRLLLDTGSQFTFITQELADMLDTEPRQGNKVNLCGIGKSEGISTTGASYKIVIEGLDKKHCISTEAYTLPTISKISNVKPQVQQQKHPHLKGLWFPDISEKDDLEIHVLIGVDDYHKIQTGRRVWGESKSAPVAVQTILGWTLAGRVDENKGVGENPAAAVHLVINKEETNVMLHKLWDLDSIGIREENDVYQEFEENLEFTGERYRVKLPWKAGSNHIPENRGVAERRLKSQLAKLRSQPELLHEYDRVMKEQLSHGIIERVDPPRGKPVHYLPHHAVVREEAETTKLRVVYDASAKSRKGDKSLNECLHIGPSLTPMLYDVLLRLRSYPVLLVADIEKAFLQIEVDEGDRDFMRLLWPTQPQDSNSELEEYRFTRVIFGAGPSPFLLNATLRYHLKKYNDCDAELIEKLKNGFYVDDLVTGAETTEDSYQLYERANAIMLEGGFKLRKWKSSDPEVRNYMKSKLPVKNEPVEESVKSIEGEKLLGLKWYPEEDMLSVQLEKKKVDVPEVVTKRNILRQTAALYDPLGVVSPVLVTAKIIMQELCRKEMGWDDPVEETIKKNWDSWMKGLAEVGEILFSRSLRQFVEERVINQRLHGFADASKKAYCACVYLVQEQSSGTYSKLITAKTRVAPLKETTIPRLELLAAKILSVLIKTVKKALNLSEECATLWSDSFTTLCWIENRGEWKQFVKTRVKEILETTSADQWRYCPTADNPADLGSRGVTATFLRDSELWWKGPGWLLKPECEWPYNIAKQSTEESEVERLKPVIHVQTEPIKRQGIENLIDLERYSSEKRVCRVTAWTFRFIHNCRRKLKIVGNLQVEEIRDARKHWIIAAQNCLRSELSFNQVCASLGVKETGDMLRCYGRLDQSELPLDAKHPILLPRGHSLTKLVIRSCHLRVLHGGVNQTLAEVRRSYWIPKGRQQVKIVTRSCITCKKVQGKSFTTPTVGDVPAVRVTQRRPFQHTGVDFAGPLYVKSGQTMQKSYIIAFSCAVTRALDLALVRNMSVELFKNELRKFIARRGAPSLFISDNAKTFKNTAKWFKKCVKSEDVKMLLEKHDIEWKFIVSLSPWWGGFYERMIGLTKGSLKKTLGNARLTFEELEVLLAEIEMSLNNRPLTYQGEDLEQPLTPSHLIFGYSLPMIAVEEDYDSDDDVGRRIRYLTKTKNHLWQRWTKEYLTALREQHKMKKNEGREITEGEVVLVSSNNHRSKWKPGIVQRLIKAKDGIIKGAEVRVITKNKPVLIQRSVQLLYPLELRRECDLEEVKRPESSETDSTISVRPRRQAAIAGRQKIKNIIKDLDQDDDEIV